MKNCRRCSTKFEPRSNAQKFCGPTCARAHKTEYEERRVAHVYAGATYLRPGSVAGVATLADVALEGPAGRSVEEMLGDAGFGVVHIPRGEYLRERRRFLDLRARQRRARRGAAPCRGCPVIAIPVQPDVVERAVKRRIARTGIPDELAEDRRLRERLNFWEQMLLPDAYSPA